MINDKSPFLPPHSSLLTPPSSLLPPHSYFPTFAAVSRFSYTTIAAPAEAKLTERKSRFLSFALPVATEEEVESKLRAMRKQFYDARHVCYAYTLGREGEVEKQSDNGEPSGTAGLPILGEIRRRGLKQVLVVVVRYFGGIKLGTSGLCAAYSAATSAALDAATTVERVIGVKAEARFPFSAMQAVMQALNHSEAKIVDTSADADGLCRLALSLPLSALQTLQEQLKKIHSLTFTYSEADV